MDKITDKGVSDLWEEHWLSLVSRPLFDLDTCTAPLLLCWYL